MNVRELRLRVVASQPVHKTFTRIEMCFGSPPFQVGSLRNVQPIRVATVGNDFVSRMRLVYDSVSTAPLPYICMRPMGSRQDKTIALEIFLLVALSLFGCCH